MSKCLLSTVALGAWLLVACGGRTAGEASASGSGSDGGRDGGVCIQIDFSKLDLRCEQASDCFGLATGTICDGQCVCPDFAASVSEQARYEAELATIELGACFCPLAPVQCLDHQCSLQGVATSGGG